VPQRTFSIIKPDAVKAGHTAAILSEIDTAGFRIVAIKKEFITKQEAEGFYAVHREKPFFGDLTDFMSSGPLYLMVLEKDNAIADLRKLMGATNPEEVRELDPGKCDPRLRRGRHGGLRNRLLVRRLRATMKTVTKPNTGFLPYSGY